MIASDHPAAYRAYLLRFWAEDSAADGQCTWRFSLESAKEIQPHGFASLEALIVFIRSEIGEIEAGHESLE